MYKAPFAVQPVAEMWATPATYRKAPGGSDLPKELKVWRVQKSGKETCGVVSQGDGFRDAPDAEVIALGYNTHKSYNEVGIGRHASFLQWGYESAPSDMTDAGRALFLNCIVYIHKFDGKAPLTRKGQK